MIPFLPIILSKGNQMRITFSKEATETLSVGSFQDLWVMDSSEAEGQF